MARRMPQVDEIIEGFKKKDRGMLARAITLVESTKQDDQDKREELLVKLREVDHSAIRVGISGVPGAGKSTFIEALGTMLVKEQKTIAVLAVDPSSTVSGGSILGDKARMNELAQMDGAFIRPSPSAQSLGGIANRTRESLLLCEAFGFDVVLVETVGVGQSETMVADMVDFFLVLMLPGAGDELQGIKRGILELADLIAVNKADGDLLPAAREAQAEYSSALRYTRPHDAVWQPKSMLVSAKDKTGLSEVWTEVESHHKLLTQTGALQEQRSNQLLKWMWQKVENRLKDSFRGHPEVKAALEETQSKVMDGSLTPTRAADLLLGLFRS